jgi:hypothetical protein
VRVSNITVELSAEDINELIAEFAPEVKIQIVAIDERGIHGQVKFMLWNIDFTAMPAATPNGQVSIEVAAHKLVAIPGPLVQRQLKEVVKDAPPGVDAIQQALRIHLPTLLQPFGASLVLDEFKPYPGYVRIKASKIQVENIKRLLQKGKQQVMTT